MENKLLTMDEFLAKIESIKNKSGADLATSEDLSIAVMNLLSLEEHFFFTAVKTKKDEYFDSSLEIREMRKKLLEQLMPNHEGETWCISKHLLSATMRLIEVGNKLYSEGEKEKAKELFKDAYKVYTIFWALKLKLIKGQNIKETARLYQDSGGQAAASSTSLIAGNSTLEDLVNKLADCCDE